MEDSISIEDLIKEEIKSEKESKNVFLLFEFVQNLLDDDDNLTRSGNLKKQALNEITKRVIELFEEDIKVLK